MKGTSKMIIVLSIVSIISGLILALTFKWTEPKINNIAAENQKKAILQVLPQARRYEEMKGNNNIFIGYDTNDNEVGIAFLAEGGGFQGDIKLMVGLDTKTEQLTGMTVLSHLETPGLGARIEESWFEGQFSGKSINDKFKAKEDVEAITGATISSNTVAHILKKTIPEVLEEYEAGGDNK